jgi:integron integrase
MIMVRENRTTRNRKKVSDETWKIVKEILLLLFIIKTQERTPSMTTFLTQARDRMRQMGYSRQTEKVYLAWIRRFLAFHRHCEPTMMGRKEIYAFLTHLAVEDNVAATTQNQAFSALLVFFREVLRRPVSEIQPLIWAKQPQRLPIVLSRSEIEQLLSQLSEPYRLMATLLYGSGLRIRECITLRVRDVDVVHFEIIVRGANEQEQRRTVLPSSVLSSLHAHLFQVKQRHDENLANGAGRVLLPPGVARQYPNADTAWHWQYVFPSPKRFRDPHTGHLIQHHRDPSGLQKAVKQAARNTDIIKVVTCQSLRDSFATHLLENGCNIRLVQELLGHKTVKATLKYTHVQHSHVKSPLD